VSSKKHIFLFLVAFVLLLFVVSVVSFFIYSSPKLHVGVTDENGVETLQDVTVTVTVTESVTVESEKTEKELNRRIEELKSRIEELESFRSQLAGTSGYTPRKQPDQETHKRPIDHGEKIDQKSGESSSSRVVVDSSAGGVDKVFEVKQPEIPVFSPEKGVSGTGMDLPVDNEKMEAVRNAMRHAWKGYKDVAFGRDELHPLSRSSHDWVAGGMGFTIIDSLDTLWLMGLKDEFYEGVDWIKRNLSFDKKQGISLFETTIRHLGGLLSAYELSGEEVLLEKADDLGRRMLPAFDTPSGIPRSTINLGDGSSSNPGWTGGSSILSEVGTLQLEFKKLAQLTGKDIYREKVDRVMDVLYEQMPDDGLLPIYVDASSGRVRGSQISFGALGDSFYEYELKQYILTSQTEKKHREMFDKSMRGMIDGLVKKSPGGSVYVAERNGNNLNPKMDHLACFIAGSLALGAADAPTSADSDKYLEVAKGLTETCYQMYARQQSGLAPEFVTFSPEMRIGADFYIQRPEAVEAFFYLWRMTGDPMYRDWSWTVFQSIEKHCKVPECGYAGIRGVNSAHPQKDDLMQSFFLAETLKYIFLSFAAEETLFLDEWVFNTEAHPLHVYTP
jgi:mannosyl-oligosaccharide alpha-1,2-mannosidase